MEGSTGKSVLVVAAHPDDEVLGCGGTILRHVRNEDEVHILIMTDGAGDVRGTAPQRMPRYEKDGGIAGQMASLAASPSFKNAHRAAHMLGVDSIQILDYPDSRFDAVDILDMAHSVESVIDRVRPQVVYTHFPGDLSVDHRRTAEAVITACRPKPGFPVKGLYFFEVASSTEWALPLTFQPQMFVGVDLKRKMEILWDAYQSETRESPHPRSRGSIESHGFMRGSQSGMDSAEAFMVGRVIQ